MNELIKAVQSILDNEYIDLADLVYEVRDREGKGWDGPQVAAWSKAVTDLKAAMSSKYDEVEPLAILGRSKDLFVTFVWNSAQWFCHITNGKGDIAKITSGPTYYEAADKAREWLEKQEDKK